jgi:hypothetical protein
MLRTTSRPETGGNPTEPAAVDDSRKHFLRRADVALILAVVSPLAIMGLLVLFGADPGVAVCVTFVLAFAVTTTMDLTWFVRRHRLRIGRSRSES